MSNFQTFIQQILADKRIDDQEVMQICDYLESDNEVDLEDVKCLIELYLGAKSYTPSFEHLFFGVLKKVILADGVISPSEQYYLLKMVYSDRVIRPRELEFLREIKREATSITPEFNVLIETALQASPNSWDVGGSTSTPNSFVSRG